jgi:hypothetical protein
VNDRLQTVTEPTLIMLKNAAFPTVGKLEACARSALFDRPGKLLSEAATTSHQA